MICGLPSNTAGTVCFTMQKSLGKANYADDFIGYNLEQRLWKAYPHCSVIGSDVVQAAALIDKLMGSTIRKYERHTFLFDRIVRVRTFRNLGSLLIEPFRKHRQQKAIAVALCRIAGRTPCLVGWSI